MEVKEWDYLNSHKPEDMTWGDWIHMLMYTNISMLPEKLPTKQDFLTEMSEISTEKTTTLLRDYLAKAVVKRIIPSLKANVAESLVSYPGDCILFSDAEMESNKLFNKVLMQSNVQSMIQQGTITIPQFMKLITG